MRLCPQPKPKRWAPFAIGVLGAACAPKLEVGAWCEPGGDAGTGNATRAPDDAVVPYLGPVQVPWENDFEDRFCAFLHDSAFCYADPHASFDTASSPAQVHSGRYAAAFTVDMSKNANQARCVREGVLPTAAYYSAWYLIPTRPSGFSNFNLFHFRGGMPPTPRPLWDVSLANGANSEPHLSLFDQSSGLPSRESTSAVPIGTWFRLEVYLRRAADATGQISVIQDGRTVIDANNLVTDDTQWGQWYFGNFAQGLTPPEFTVYVDDVSIRTTR